MKTQEKVENVLHAIGEVFGWFDDETGNVEDIDVIYEEVCTKFSNPMLANHCRLPYLETFSFKGNIADEITSYLHVYVTREDTVLIVHQMYFYDQNQIPRGEVVGKIALPYKNILLRVEKLKLALTETMKTNPDTVEIKILIGEMLNPKITDEA